MTPKKRTGLHLTRKIYSGELRYRGIAIREEDILEAMTKTSCNLQAANYLGISYPTYRKYAKIFIDPLTGKTLWELHLNQGGEGVKKPGLKQFRDMNLDEILRPNQINTEKRVRSLRLKLMQDGRLGHECHKCGYNKRRELDNELPLMLNFKDGDKTNWVLDNLELVCYNCFFHAGIDSFSKMVMRNIEGHGLFEEQSSESAKETFYQVSKEDLERLRMFKGIEEAKQELEKPKESDTKNEDGTELSLVSYLW